MTPRFPDAPAQILALPVDSRNWPVPWFVDWFDGVPDFRVMDGRKLRKAIKEDRCWVCGGRLGRMKAFVIGPMCAVNRISGEPPSHLPCAVFAAKACPFLTQPKRLRNENGAAGDLASANAGPAGGEMIERNPGVTLVWSTLRHSVEGDGHGGILFDVGKPARLQWFAHGREATRAEVMASIASGLPALEEMAHRDGPDAVAQLQRMVAEAMPLVPA